MKSIKPSVCAFAAACSLTLFAARDNNLADFPRYKGETDDAPRFQRAIDASASGVLTVPGDDYTFAQTVYVSNLCSIVMSPSARIKAVAKMEWMIKIDAMWQYNRRTTPKGVNSEQYNLTYRGGTLDADGLASCLAIDNYRHFTLENATFLNGKVYGVGIETTGRGYEMIARNLFIKTNIPGLAGNTGLYTYGGDSHYTDIIVTDYTTGVHFAGRGANRLTRIHVWGGPVKPPKPGELPEMLKNSVCFRIDSCGEILRDCYADTGAIGFWMNGWENRMFGCSYFNNTGFNLKDVTVIRQDRGTLWVSGGLFNRQTPDTRLYVGSPVAKIHWSDDSIMRYRSANDKTVPDMIKPTVMPVNIDVGRQLFLNDSLLAMNKAKRKWHKPVKDSRSPVLKPETALEKGGKNGWNPVAAPFVGGVWYDGAEGLFKCWYNAGWANGQAYAYSKDGIVWTRPAIQPDGGNLVYRCNGTRDQGSVVMDVDALDGYPFKSFMYVCGEARKNYAEVRKSKNGIDWTAPVRTAGTGDATSIFYNPFKRQWCFSVRSWNKTDGRTRHLAYDSNFETGARYLPQKAPWLKDAVGGLSKDGEELYNMDAVAYESVMIGLCQVMKQPQNDEWAKKGEPKSTSLRFGFSTPENIWTWKFPKMSDGGEFIAETRRSGDWDMGYIRSNSGVCIVMDDEIRFYYTGFAGDRSRERSQSVHRGGMYANGSMGLATLRRDGFCSLSDGTVETKPLVFTKGDRLWLNADAKSGSIEVTAEDLSGKRIGTCLLKGEDSTRRQAFKLPSHTPFKLKFSVRDGAELYAFWSSDASGKSGGYLGGGSPSSKTLRDE